MLYFTTFFDFNYLPRALVMIHSLKECTGPFRMYVLCLDEKTEAYFRDNPMEEVITIPLSKLEEDAALVQAKANRSRVEYIFTLSPALPLYVLEHFPEVDRITSLDADLCFYSNPEVLFRSGKSIYISPHRFSEANRRLEKYGKYNVSFQSFRRDDEGLACLRKWKADCLEWCKDVLEGERYADQKYLDAWPALFKSLEVIQHKGACVATWNLDRSPVSKNQDVYFVIDEPLVFYHFHGVRKNRFNMYKLSIYDYCKSIGEYEKELYVNYISHMQQMQKNLETREIKRSASKYPLLSDYYAVQPFGRLRVIKIINFFYPKSIFHKK